MPRIMFALALVSLTACDNPCQAFCTTLADYADECGQPFSDAELESCIDDWSSASKAEKGQCVDYGTPDRLRREWTCDDVNLYRDNPANASGAQDDSGSPPS